MQKMQEIELSKIVSNRYQPRTLFVEEEIEELAASIEEVGLLHPPLLTPILGTDTFEIIAGERRVMACRYLKLRAIMAIVKPRPSEQALAQAALIENVQRVDLNPIEVARSMKSLIDEFGFSQEELGFRLGKKRSTIANTLRILQLSKEMQEALASSKITLAHAKVLLSCTGKTRERLFKTMLKEKMSVQQATKLVKDTKPECIHLRQLEGRLEEFFRCRVKLDGASKSGSIQITYENLDDLDRILALIGLEEQ